MKLSKYHGTGNDFILVDDRTGEHAGLAQAGIARLCHRRFGIGADGLILIRPALGLGAAFSMVYYNADGGLGSFCGNGARCTVAFAYRLGLGAGAHQIIFEAVDGLHAATHKTQSPHVSWVEVRMRDTVLPEPHPEGIYLDTGSPHLVVPVEELAEAQVVTDGRRLRLAEPYGSQGGVNVNYLQLIDDQMIAVRTYERGVEDETYSCGTGVTAAALVAATYGMAGPLTVRTPGGELSVRFTKHGAGFSEVYLSGPAEWVFAGEV